LKPEDEEYSLHVLIKQISFFGPFPLKYQEVIDLKRLQQCTIVQNYINKNSLQRPSMILKDPEITSEDKEIICRSMKLDLRKRPTAKKLLQDKWLRQ
jgi:hypothetical protein